MKLVYVSGPYSDDRGLWFVNQNIRAAESVAIELWKMGFSVICPHKNTEHLDGQLTWEEFIQGDYRQIEACDAVVMLPEWRRSKGARAERLHALQHHVPVYYWPGHRHELEELAFVESVRDEEKRLRQGDEKLAETQGEETNERIAA